MRLLYLLLFIIVSFTIPLLANDDEKHEKLPLEVCLPILKTIENSALHMGEGPVKVHVFIDPYCPHSRDFIEMIAESDKMRSRYSYNFYLYTLPRMHSEEMVATIYASSNPLALLLDVMVAKKEVAVEKVSDQTIQRKIDLIAEAAKKLDVYKRPYIIMVKMPMKKREY
ncbi:MAG: hypothetical protein PF439_07620 [Helicobacteraceae bacterium]|jgi:hypothetical protein|nr:hypothetical protein [Helicobacteraceae bacterium]